MSIWRLVFKEALRRRLNFILAAAAVLAAVTCLVGAVTFLRAHDMRTEWIVERKEARTRKAMESLEEEYRFITKKMGFNILILPKGQNLGDLYADDYASEYMPEEYVERLANSKIMSVRHLLPSLQQKLVWPERQRTVILIGTRGEVPLEHRAARDPILEPVPPGTMVVGYELHRSLNLSVGDKLRLLDREFTVGRLHEERGTKDDITIWVNLAEAQELLDKRGLINGILALECRCAWADLARVREDVSRILPETQIIEMAGKALARAEARRAVERAASEAIEAERRNRGRLRRERENLAAVLVPVVLATAALWVGILALLNVRERRPEIGILRAMGLRSRQVLALFVAKAALVGLAGAIPGYALGWTLGGSWEAVPGESFSASSHFDLRLALLVVVVTPVFAGVAAWLPALVASRSDPADVLREV